MDSDSTEDTPAIRVGRPTDERKTEAILDAARTVFLGGGYAAASIERISEIANVSKVTLYKRFGDKAGLLEALVRRQAQRMSEAIGEANRDAPTLHAQLINFGTTLLGFLFDESHLHFDSILAVEREHHPDATKRFFEAGPGTMRRQLAAILSDAANRGEVRIHDAKQAAEDLLSLWKGFREIEMRFGVAKAPGPRRIKNHVTHTVDIFLRAYSPD